LAIDYASSDGDRSRHINKDAQSLTLPEDLVGNAAASLAPGPLENRHEMWNSKLNVSTAIWELDTFSWNLIDAGVGTGAAQALDPAGYDENDYYGSNFLIKPLEFGDAWTFNGNLGFTVLDLDAHFVLFPPGTEFAAVTFDDGVIGNPSYLEKTTFGEMVSNHVSDSMNIRIAVGFRSQEFEAGESKNFGSAFGTLVDVSGTSEVYIKNDDREHYYVSLQNEWAFANDWELTAGVRYDTFTQFGDSINPRIALVWATTHNLTTKFLYGRAFRAPSFSELFAENNPSLIGNANLKPEIIDTLEMAFDYRVNQDLNFRLNLFSYQIEDLVEILFGTPASNSGQQSGKGLEFEAEWDMNDNLSFSGNYAWQDAEDDTTGADVPNAAQQQLYLTAAWQLSDHLTLSGVVNYVADRRRAIGGVREDIGDNKTVDLVLRSHRAIRGLDVSLIARNVLDSDVREPSTGQFPAMPEIPDDYPLDGRSINLTFEYHFDR
jgi:iron complex outermembrane receptor protein